MSIQVKYRIQEIDLDKRDSSVFGFVTCCLWVMIYDHIGEYLEGKRKMKEGFH
jgi:hypothetical protein